MKEYLITGGAGFIGNNFAEKLLKRGDRVIILDNLSRRGTNDNLKYLQKKYPSVKFVQSDIVKDLKTLKKLVETVDVVFHLAGQVAVTTSVKNPREDFQINALGSFNVLEAIRQSNKKPILVYSSTNKVYGGMEEIKIIEGEKKFEYEKLQNGIPETQQLDFHSPYGCSKGTADQYVRDYSRIYGLKTVVMRQSCIYGIRQFGIEDQGWLAWFTIASILKRPITIYGNGKQVRDVLFVDDLFEAWDMVVSQIENTNGKIYNVGGGIKNTLSLLELIKIIEQELNQKIKFRFSDWRPGDQPVYISDITKIEKDIGWKPKTNPKKGVQKLISWVNSNKNLLEKVLNF